MKTPRASKVARDLTVLALQHRCAELEAENVALVNQRIADEGELRDAAEQCNKLEAEIRHLKNQNERLYTIMDREHGIQRARTTALCALLNLPDPGKTPPPYEVEE